MPQEPFGGLLVNETRKASSFRPSLGVQLDHMMAVIKDGAVPCATEIRLKRYTDMARYFEKGESGTAGIAVC